MLPPSKNPTQFDNLTIEKRRDELLMRLSRDEHPLTILRGLEQSETAVFIIDDKSAFAIRRGLSNPLRLMNESVALATVQIAAQTPNKSQFVYQIVSFRFENLGTADSVLSLMREEFHAGEIEVHTHLYSSPDYLGQTDIGDLIAAIEGPSWVHPQLERRTTAQRIFGILSIYPSNLAELQFYLHDLREPLIAENHYGLKRLGMPITLTDVY